MHVESHVTGSSGTELQTQVLFQSHILSHMSPVGHRKAHLEAVQLEVPGRPLVLQASAQAAPV